MTSHLVLTVDYELFGDGSGSLDACVLKPADQMMRIAEGFDAPVTFFVEALECMALAEQLGDRRAQKQMGRALGRGHNVQLHLHPQWMNAVYDVSGHWLLDNRYWRIGDLSENEVNEILQRGKNWLEAEVARNVPDYRCLAFRAGGWCIQPSDAIIKGMQKYGLFVESTVAPKAYNPVKGEWCDFRDAPELPYWFIDRNVCEPSSSGIIEVPIATGKIGRLRHLKALKASRSAGNGGMAPECIGSYRGPDGKYQSVRGKATKLLRLGQVMLDFSTMPGDVLIDLTSQWINRHKGAAGPLPIVAIAHTKNFTPASADALNTYLNWAKRQGIEFSTYERWYEALNGQ